jgi:hypothetical protein
LADAKNPAPLPWSSAREIDDDLAFLEEINTAGYIDDRHFARLAEIRSKYFFDLHGVKTPFLSDGQWEALSVRKGNLTAIERDRINSHASATRRILSQIPWTKDMERIPEIACHHHEKIDGSGYPDGLLGDQIGLEEKILAVVDIYEALVAQNRPYKPNMTPEKALGILQSEVEARRLDKDIVEFFISSGVYTLFSFDQTTDDDARSNRHSTVR